MKHKLVLSIFIAAILFACNAPLKRTYSAESFLSDIQEIRDENNVSESETEVLVDYILRSRLAGRNFEGIAYSEILQEAKTIRDAKDETAHQNRETINKAERLNKLIDVKVISKKLIPNENRIELSFEIENKKDKS